MSLFQRGMTVHPLNEDKEWRQRFREQQGILPGTTLLWAGRISRDKNITFLLDVYLEACTQTDTINLVLCGDGPDLTVLKKRFGSHERIHFMGRVPSAEMEHFYDIADLFVFPSTTDTFGMVILEAQARGLPALVSDKGGPQEIISDNETGHILDVDRTGPWMERILALHHMKTHHPQEFHALRLRCHEHIRKSCDWENALADITGTSPENIRPNNQRERREFRMAFREPPRADRDWGSWVCPQQNLKAC